MGKYVHVTAVALYFMSDDITSGIHSMVQHHINTQIATVAMHKTCISHMSTKGYRILWLLNSNNVGD